MFESRCTAQTARFDRARPIFVEGESSKVGRLSVPPAMFAEMKTAHRVGVALPRADRVARIRRQYAHFETTHVAELLDAVGVLDKSVGKAVTDAWRADIAAGDFEAFVGSLLDTHYDVVYQRAVDRDRGVGAAVVPLPLAANTPEAYREAAAALVAEHDAAAVAVAGVALRAAV